ncbi:AFG1-like ATPase [Rhizoclosmatium globosum]|uniref:AFG1-like ATPase n=1 Tax=Rhizoclosmatium globosum TaxID=329046 RepID=A0A1Y2CUI4_9FUNG|nr:AFG1-like ATPase [Rhizoclosmatium globosum]|eukprot:ORY50718.1 AFG1-like ATPase [Rhizoclosmatium globosum]
MFRNSWPHHVYASKIASGALREDPHQLKTVGHLQTLHDTILSHPPPPPKPVVEEPVVIGPKGLYLHGDVGTGKTLTMDMFYHSLDIPRKRRVHFHAFMQDVHRRVHQLRKDKGVSYDPTPLIAQELANDAWVLCFDELKRLFTELYKRGVVTVVTSNRPPDELYKNGLQRKSFLPTIELLKSQNLVHPLDSGIDYRQRAKAEERVFFYPLGPETTASINSIWNSLTNGKKVEPKTLTFLGRSITIPETCGRAAKASFQLLCGSPHSAADFLEIASQFDTIVLTDVPKMTLTQRNEARRFITLIDAIYENKIKFYMSSEVEAGLLLVGDKDEAGKLDKKAERELTAAERQLMDDLKITVDHLTSSIFTGSEEAFAFQRAVSRLVEMQGKGWGDKEIQ